jgi:hypothetical protein
VAFEKKKDGQEKKKTMLPTSLDMGKPWLASASSAKAMHRTYCSGSWAGAQGFGEGVVEAWWQVIDSLFMEVCIGLDGTASDAFFQHGWPHNLHIEPPPH